MDIQADGYVVCADDSMGENRFPTGAKIRIKNNPTSVKNGQIVLVRTPNGETVRRWFEIGDMIVLMPDNPAYEPMTFTHEELAQGIVRVLGLVVEVHISCE